MPSVADMISNTGYQDNPEALLYLMFLEIVQGRNMSLTRGQKSVA